ncbi:hypoxanthine phosphoribosyltransferase [Desulfurobacterium sp.]|uniref:hypoxanthine phosphoribosyltransferase n=1 Tax=Desulfurobacterium sp. TaxID=2004706 RepID=UPI00260E10E8|nr:hypoxanthine phosphoribosyltransferase [Desulfurobacterium sp.]
MKVELKILIPEEEIKKRLKELGREISEAFNGEKVTAVCILKGAFIFTADLIREMKTEVEVEFMRIKSYEGMEKREDKLLYDVECDIKGKNVLIIDDILDTGGSLKFATKELKKREPAQLKTCVLLEKKREKDFKADFVGFKIPDKFVVGYGLDVNELYRDLPYIAVAENDNIRSER